MRESRYRMLPLSIPTVAILILAVISIRSGSFCPVVSGGGVENGGIPGGSDNSSGPIIGSVIFRNGPREGDGVSGALIELLDPENGNTLRSTYADETGSYILHNVSFADDLTIRANPPADETGKWDERTGYLPSVSSPFNHSSETNTSVNFLLNYYIFDPVEPHPRIIIMDQNGDPVAGAVVEASYEGKRYTATADINGEAEFFQFVGEEFPDGTAFTAESSGYLEAEWEQGDDVPRLREVVTDDGDGSDSWIVLVVFILTIAVFIALILITGMFDERKKAR
ncbi:MAG: hypothetical protein ACMUIG_08330 [Thermoplasmatota archaeon]